jgi:hypothetical protein
LVPGLDVQVNANGIKFLDERLSAGSQGRL